MFMFWIMVYLSVVVLFYTFVKVETRDRRGYHREWGYAFLWPIVFLFVLVGVCTGDCKINKNTRRNSDND